jgi:predicted metal-dependent hydrolase
MNLPKRTKGTEGMMQESSRQKIDLDGWKMDYRLVQSKSARKLRVRVGIDGVEVLQPEGRDFPEVEKFLKSSSGWIMNQLERVERLRLVRKPFFKSEGAILFRGVMTPVRVEGKARRKGTNKVIFEDGELKIILGMQSNTSAVDSLENWLRKKAKEDIRKQIDLLTAKLRKYPHKIYVMGQKTKWGNCSALQNLSFNWRLIMAPDFVLRYLVTHEVVHLEVPDHSKRFWLTVQSLCPEMDRARQWLVANSDRLMMDIKQTL